MNEDLVGKTYRNGPMGDRWRVTGTHKRAPHLVAVENVSNGRTASAIADFVREFLE